MIFGGPKSKRENDFPEEKDNNNSKGLLRIIRRKQEKKIDVVKERRNLSQITTSTKCSRSILAILEEGEPSDPMACVDTKDDAAALQRCKPQASVLTCHSALTFAAAHEEAQQRQVPLLVIVHGSTAEWRPLCNACSHVLKNPLLAEAAEALFSPIRVDASETLDDKLKSAAGITEQDIAGSPLPFLAIIYNDTVMRPQMWSVAAIADTMVEARTAAGLPVPSYLSLLAEETPAAQCTCQAGPVPASHRRKSQQTNRSPPFSASNISHAYFGVRCHPTSEVRFADLAGVVATEAGWLNHHKSLQITYDSKRLSYGDLVQHVLATNAADTIYFNTNDQKAAAQIQMRQQLSHPISYARLVQYTTTDSSSSQEHAFRNGADRKHYLRTTILRSVPLTELQKMKANSYISNGKFHEAMKLLSPRQGLILRACTQSTRRKIMQDKIDPIDVEIGQAWQVLSDFGFFD